MSSSDGHLTVPNERPEMARSPKNPLLAYGPGRGAGAGVGVAGLAAVIYAVGFTLYAALDPAVSSAGLPPGIGFALLLSLAGWVAATLPAALVGALLKRTSRPVLVGGYGVVVAAPIALVPTVLASASALLAGRVLVVSVVIAAVAALASAFLHTRTGRVAAEHTLRPGASIDPTLLPTAPSVGTPGLITGPIPFGP